MGQTLYTIGYSGRTATQLFVVLRGRGVQRIVDVRAEAWSPNPAYCGPALSSLAQDLGVGYLHFPAVGNPRRIRQSHTHPGPALQAYEAFLRERRVVLVSFAKLLRDGDCLLCTCREAWACHRGTLAGLLLDLGLLEGWHVDHIGPGQQSLFGGLA